MSKEICNYFFLETVKSVKIGVYNVKKVTIDKYKILQT
jgi:hypothetical protein